MPEREARFAVWGISDADAIFYLSVMTVPVNGNESLRTKLSVSLGLRTTPNGHATVRAEPRAVPVRSALNTRWRLD